MTAVDRVLAAFERIAEVDRPEIWITLRDLDEVLADAVLVDAAVAAGETLPLAGRLLAVKDNIDVAGLPTTAGCPDYGFQPERNAPAVQRLIAAGAIVFGKTNLDQFATGLVGVRSPYGAVRDATRPERISGGSSSGSAVAVALGIVDLALATDTAGSGRVPAALQGIVGIKATRGLVPTRGVVPACRSLDCVTVLAPTLAAAEQAMSLIIGPDPADPMSRAWPADAPLGAPARPKIAVPGSDQLTDLDPAWRVAFERTASRLEQAGAELVPIDLKSYLSAARMMYQSAFVAERFAAVGEFVTAHPESVDPTVRSIIEAAGAIPAHQVTTDLEQLDRLRLAAAAALGDADALLLPTTTHHPTIAEVLADPIGVNSRLGTYTNFCNLLDLCAIALPSGEFVDGDSFGVSVIVRAFADRVAGDIAGLLAGQTGPRGAGPTGIGLVVVGAHLSGQPLNHQLTSRGGRLISPVRTSPEYALYLLDTVPPKPGLVRVAGAGESIEAELWELPPAGLASFLEELPSPMALGSVRLADGTTSVGFLVEPAAVIGARDITHFHGWRKFLLSAGSQRK
ncbi:MAG TPA: allophanate hydrolase [Kineosporiaceae bacterium]|nr:allophanate hydrolase [Kineosporiaceae bacterium]